jgi:hypothetical protein
MKIQCAKCPWKLSTDPHAIPDGYCIGRHQRLKETIAEPGSLPAPSGVLRIMACHESTPGEETPCAGWVWHQLGPGNNLALRLAALAGRIDGDVRVSGPQHDTFENTLPVAHEVKKL